MKKYSYDPFLLVILLCTTILYLFGNSSLAITDPVESNYALTAKEILLSGDYLSPRIFDHVWYDKPVFFYLELVLAYKIFGFTDFATRFFPSLFGVANVYLIYSFAKRIMNRRIARIAAMMMAVSAESWVFSKAAITDSTLVFFFSTTLISFYIGYKKRKSTGSSSYYYYLAYVAAAFGILTKGPVAFLLPGAIILAFLLVRHDVRELLHMHLIPGLLIILGLGGSWYLYMYAAHGDAFVTTFLGVHNWLRATVSEHPRDNVWYYYLMVNTIALIPWTPMILVKAFTKRSTIPWGNAHIQFLGIWALLVILFFQAMATKYMTYTFPALMPLLILCAYWWQNNEKTVRNIAVGTAIIYLVLTATLAIPLTHKQSDYNTASYLTHYTTHPDTIVLDSRNKYHVSTSFYSGKKVYKLDVNESISIFDPKHPPLSWDVKNMMPIMYGTNIPKDRKVVLITDSDQFPSALLRADFHLTHQGPDGDIYVKNQ